MNWAPLLQDYGPFALLPFSMLVIERIAANRAHDTKLPEKTRNLVYTAAWVMIFTLCGAVLYFWWLGSSLRETEAMLRGKVTGLGTTHLFRATGPDGANVRVFLYRDMNRPDQLLWRAFSATRLDEKTQMELLVDASTRSSDEIWMFPFAPSRSYYGRSMELNLSYDPVTHKLKCDNCSRNQPVVIIGRKVVTAAAEPGTGEPPLPYFGAVYAMSNPSTGDLLRYLDADDPSVRLRARQQLAKAGPEAFREMDKALARVDSSYRVRLGIIVAANQAKSFRAEQFSTAAWCSVWGAAQSGDETMQGQARLLLSKQPAKPSAATCANLKRLEYQRKMNEAMQVYRAPSAEAKK
ncbi:MAG: hypothetical protein ACKV22_15600 [Bryobacteraceae bacterium]